MLTEIKRDRYLNRLIARKWNGSVKVVTGLRRCGKSYLLFKLFKDHLVSEGVDPKNIISIALDDIRNRPMRDPDVLYRTVTDSVGDGEYYLLLDEIQFVDGFEDVINGFRHVPRLDIYVTGSNSKMLSGDILTEFRGRGDEVRVQPLSFSEFASAFNGTADEAWNIYLTFGGLPELFGRTDSEQKTTYLQNLMKEVYLKDLIEHNEIRLTNELDMMTDLLCSSVGSLTNPLKISNTLKTTGSSRTSEETVSKYLSFLEESFLFERSKRYDIKGRKYFGTPSKYYAADVGLRNARLNFRQQKMTHIMENVLYNELRSRGFSVDVGVVETKTTENGVTNFKQLEIDFVANKGDQRYYIQCAYRVPDEDKKEQELRPFLKVGDSFRKIIVVGDDIRRWTDDNGVITIGVKEFLLDESYTNL